VDVLSGDVVISYQSRGDLGKEDAEASNPLQDQALRVEVKGS
jgi:hypothetical protein